MEEAQDFQTSEEDGQDFGFATGKAGGVGWSKVYGSSADWRWPSELRFNSVIGEGLIFQFRQRKHRDFSLGKRVLGEKNNKHWYR